jgi:hypothetical protein
MSDPVGTVGGAAHVSDMEVAMMGGSKFMQRLQQLADAKDSHDEALGKLRLAAAAKDMHAAAEIKHQEASRLQTEAADVLAAANEQAKQILGDAADKAAETIASAGVEAAKLRDDARVEAAAALAGARNSANEMLASATKEKQEADAYAAGVRGEADSTKMMAVALHEGASGLKKDADAAMATADTTKMAAAAAKQSADQMLVKVRAVADAIANAVKRLP